MKKGKISITKLIEYIENDSTENDFSRLKELLSQEQHSNHKLNKISSWLVDRAINVFVYNQSKGNTLDLFKILYDSCFEEIVQNVGDSLDRNNLVEVILRIMEEDPDNVLEKNRLYNIIINSFPNEFNHLLMNNIDEEKLKTDRRYLERVENIYSFIAEFNHCIRNDPDFEDEEEFGWDKILEYIKLRKKDAIFLNSDLFERITLNSCEAYSYGNDLSEKQYDILKDYIDSATKREDFNLFENHGICDLLQIISCPQKESAQIKELERIIRRNLKVSNINIKKTLENIRIIMKKKGLNEIEVQKLFREIQKIKLAFNWHVPEDITRYVISECFNENSALYKKRGLYQGYINRILENFGANNIPKEMLEMKHYYYFMRPQIGMTDPSGMQTSNAVYVREEDQKELLETLNTIFHENTHIEQEYCTKYAKKYSYVKYMILKEDLINQTLLDYSALNYRTLFSEIDARAKASLKMLKFIFSLDGVKEKVDLNRIIQNYNREILYYIGAYEKKDGNNEETSDINDIFEKLLDGKPELLEQNPIFLVEYNPDGSLRSPEELIRFMEKGSRSQRELIIKILENNNIFKPENLFRDFTFLFNFSSSDESIEKSVSHIIKSVFSKLLYARYNKFDELNDGEKKELYDIIKRTKQSTSSKAFRSGVTKELQNGVTIVDIVNQMEKYIRTKNPELLGQDILVE